MQLGGALTVTPVTDPHEVARPLDVWNGMESANVGCLVPGPRAVGPAAVEVDVADDATESEDAVVVTQVVRRHRLRLRRGPVVRVVEEQAVARPRAVAANRCDQ